MPQTPAYGRRPPEQETRTMEDALSIANLRKLKGQPVDR